MSVKSLFLSAAAVLALAVPATAGEPGASRYYVEGAGGVAFSGDVQVNGTDGEVDTGWNVGGAAGMYVTPNLGVELDVFYNDRAAACCSDDKINALSFMVDAVYGFNPDGFVNPYLGVGLGTVRVEGVDGSNSESDWKFGYQAMAGVMLNVSETVGVFAEYRFHDAVGDAEVLGVDLGYNSHNASAGLRLNF